MAKVQIKFDSITPFGGIFSIMDQFDALFIGDNRERNTTKAGLPPSSDRDSPFCLKKTTTTSPPSLRQSLALLREQVAHLPFVRVTVCNTLPCLSIIRNSSTCLSADTIEKPGSPLQNTVPSTGFTLRLSEPAELVI